MIAEAAHVLATPVSVLVEMDWRDVLSWHEEAGRIIRARGM